VIVPLAAFWYSDPPTLLQTDMLSVMIIAVSVVIAYCFIVGELSKNNSQVDKLWSIIPIYYACHMTALGGFHPRMILMSALVCVWGIRLTYNFARRGAYQWKFWQGEEDYRWEILRQKPGFNRKPVWMAFNLFFISTYQNILIFLFTLPILTALSSGAPKQITQADIVLSLLFLAAVVVEFIADQQQYDFQTEKHRRLMAGEPLQQYAAGFVSTGLWSLVRHPNYAMEQLIWILFYCFSIVATGNWMNWSIPGCLLLIALFKGSSDFSESISAKKYPAYTEYKKKVPRFIPFIK
jgi:steroid 5-alpha reductase family enzyme